MTQPNKNAAVETDTKSLQAAGKHRAQNTQNLFVYSDDKIIKEQTNNKQIDFADWPQ